MISAGAFGAFSAIAPGSWIEIYGANLAGNTRSWNSSDFSGVNAPTSLDGTSVTIGGQKAFIDYISPGQVNAQVPSAVGSGFQGVVVTTAAGASASYTITVNAVEPGLLAPPSFNIGGNQYVGALFSDGATFVLPPELFRASIPAACSLGIRSRFTASASVPSRPILPQARSSSRPTLLPCPSTFLSEQPTGR